MKNLKILLAFLFILSCHQAALSQIRYKGKVVGIVDGKTVVIELATRNKLTAELQYIEVPEPEQQLHQTVKEHLQNLVLGKDVEFLAKGMTLTKTVGQMFSSGVDVSQQMIRDGAAWHAVLKNPGLDAGQRETYENSAAQAKAEKRGIWAVGNLRPAWEFRAQKEAVSKPPEKIEPETTAAPTSSKGRRWTVEERQKANASVQMWADVSDPKSKKSAELTANLFSHYDPSRKIGYVATSGSVLNLRGSGKLQKVWCQVSYLYKGEETSVSESIYAVAILSEGAQYKFLQFNDLTVFADGQKIYLGKARRVWREMPSTVQELMLYKIGRTSLMKIANAKKLSVKLGTYSGSAGSEAQDLIKNLLSNVN